MPLDLVSYIRIETEAIRDFNDKQMISSYCLSKLEMFNWYLELLEVGSEKYIVPQSRAYIHDSAWQDHLLSKYWRDFVTPIYSNYVIEVS